MKRLLKAAEDINAIKKIKPKIEMQLNCLITSGLQINPFIWSLIY